jgi:uncharacterized coiled-coil protein SlyX
MIFKRMVPYEAAVLEIAQILLDPLREIIPEVVASITQNLNGGRTPDQAGQVLLKGLIAWRDGIAGVEVKTALQRQEQCLIEIRSKGIEQTKTIVDLQRKTNSQEQRTGEQELVIEALQKTIQKQNSIISEQHNRLIALLGHAQS